MTSSRSVTARSNFLVLIEFLSPADQSNLIEFLHIQDLLLQSGQDLFVSQSLVRLDKISPSFLLEERSKQKTRRSITIGVSFGSW